MESVKFGVFPKEIVYKKKKIGSFKLSLKPGTVGVLELNKNKYFILKSGLYGLIAEDSRGATVAILSLGPCGVKDSLLFRRCYKVMFAEDGVQFFSDCKNYFFDKYINFRLARTKRNQVVLPTSFEGACKFVSTKVSVEKVVVLNAMVNCAFFAFSQSSN